MVGEPGSLTGFIMDEIRRGKASDIAQQVQNGDMKPQDAILAYAQATGDENAMAKGALAKLSGSIPWQNPSQAIPQAMGGGLMSPTEGYTALANPMLQMGGMGQPQGNPQPAPQGQPAPNGQPQQPQYPGGLGPDGPDDKRNYNFLATMPPSFRGLIKGISEGDEHAGMVARANPQAAIIMNGAYQFDPSLSQPGAGPDSRVKANVAFGAGGKEGLTRAAINTAIQHTSQLAATTADLHNQQSPMWNAIGNYANQKVTGDNTPTNFDAVADRLAPELAKVSSGTGVAAEGEIKTQRDGLQKNGSPEQQYGAYSNIMDLVGNKAKELGNTYKSTMGRSIPMISPENQQHLVDIKRMAQLAKEGKENGLEATQILQRLRNVQSPDAQDAAPTAQAQPSRPPLTPEIARQLAIKKGLIKQ